LRDLQIGRGQLPQLIRRSPEATRSLGGMIERLAIDRRAIPGSAWRSMMWTCTTCPTRPDCDDFLARRRHIVSCPNAAVLRGLPRGAQPASAPR
jgi:hypothetical protein